MIGMAKAGKKGNGLYLNGKHPCRREIVSGMKRTLVNIRFNSMVLIVWIGNHFHF
jgi:hypothetical protein